MQTQRVSLKNIYSFPLHNVSICDFCSALNECLTQYTKLAQEYSIQSFDSDAKKLLTHCIVQFCCDTALQIPKGKIVFYYSEHCIAVDDGEIRAFILKLLKEIHKQLPLSWYCSSKPLNYYLNLISHNLAISFLMQIENSNKHNYSYSKAKRFINKYKLIFLNDQYFNNLKTRCWLLNK